MTAQAFPALGFDPAPGDPAAARDLARTIGLLAHEVGAAASTLSGADSQDWTGLHADAFRAHLHQDVLPLVRTAVGSFGRAAAALGTWGRLLEGFAAEAVILKRRAGPRSRTRRRPRGRWPASPRRAGQLPPPGRCSPPLSYASRRTCRTRRPRRTPGWPRSGARPRS